MSRDAYSGGDGRLIAMCSIIGFLFGFSLAASFAAYNLLDEYKQASAALQASVEELKLSTEKVRGTFPLYPVRCSYVRIGHGTCPTHRGC